MRGSSSPAWRWALFALAWLGGVAMQLREAELAAAGPLAALAAAAAGSALAAWRWRRHALGMLALALTAAAAGYATTSSRAAWRLADALPAALEGQDLIVTGVVAELPRTSLIGTRFVLETESATWQGAAVALPARLALGWYRSGDDEPLLGGAPEDLRAGQRWRLPLRLRAPHGTFNPNGFDLELWLFEQGIGASGSVRVRAATPPLRLAEGVGHPVERLRQSLRDAIQRRVRDPLAAGVLAALAIGDQAAIDREGWDLFRITGVAHLMSISGLHVTMFAWLAAACVGRLWRLRVPWLLACPAPVAARWGGWAAAAGYALLAGWGVPAQRTVWMIGVVVLLRSAGVRWPLQAVLLAAAWVVAVLDPWALLQPGFWLSFVAVALLVASAPVHAPVAPGVGLRRRIGRWLSEGLRTQAVATVGLTPLTLAFFQQLSLVGFLANLVAIPLVTLVITPLALLGVLAPPLWVLDGALVQALVAGLRMMASWPLAVWSAAAAPPWAVACGLLGAALAVLPLPMRLRLCALPLLLPLLLPPVPRPPEGRFELVAADIGQGTAVLVRTREHLLVYDSGPQYSAESDAGGRVLLPLLRARGETRIDLLMLSHRDADHVGGAATLLAALPVGLLSSSLADDHPLRAAPVPHRPCAAGQAWDWDGVHFAVLHPLAAELGAGLKPNALSCVLRIQGTGGSALLTGDIEAPQEAALIRRAGAQLSAEVLLVPHHGSRTSSTAAFIEAVQPQLAVVQAAYRSRFGHPAPDVVARYREHGVPVVRSDRCGAWAWNGFPVPDAGAPRPPPTAGSGPSTGAPAGVAGVCERQSARRYWHHRASADPPDLP